MLRCEGHANAASATFFAIDTPTPARAIGYFGTEHNHSMFLQQRLQTRLLNPPTLTHTLMMPT